MAKKPAPTQNAWAMRHYVDLGWDMEVVERVIRLGGGKAVKFDFYGFGDLYGFKGPDHLIVQVTTYQHHAERMKKVLGNPIARKWINGSRYNHIEVISIDQIGRSKEKGSIRISEVTLVDFV